MPERPNFLRETVTPLGEGLSQAIGKGAILGLQQRHEIEMMQAKHAFARASAMEQMQAKDAQEKAMGESANERALLSQLGMTARKGGTVARAALPSWAAGMYPSLQSVSEKERQTAAAPVEVGPPASQATILKAGGYLVPSEGLPTRGEVAEAVGPFQHTVEAQPRPDLAAQQRAADERARLAREAANERARLARKAREDALSIAESRGADDKSLQKLRILLGERDRFVDDRVRVAVGAMKNVTEKDLGEWEQKAMSRALSAAGLLDPKNKNTQAQFNAAVKTYLGQAGASMYERKRYLGPAADVMAAYTGRPKTRVEAVARIRETASKLFPPGGERDFNAAFAAGMKNDSAARKRAKDMLIEAETALGQMAVPVEGE